MPALVAAAAGKMVELEDIQQPSTSNQFEILVGIQKHPNQRHRQPPQTNLKFRLEFLASNLQSTQAKAPQPQRLNPAHQQLVGNLMSLVDRELKRTKTNQSDCQTWDVWQEDERHLAMRRHSDGLELQAIYKDAQWQPVELPLLSTKDVQALQEFTQRLEQWLRERDIEQKKELEPAPVGALTRYYITLRRVLGQRGSRLYPTKRLNQKTQSQLAYALEVPIEYLEAVALGVSVWSNRCFKVLSLLLDTRHISRSFMDSARVPIFAPCVVLNYAANALDVLNQLLL